MGPADGGPGAGGDSRPAGTPRPLAASHKGGHIPKSYKALNVRGGQELPVGRRGQPVKGGEVWLTSVWAVPQEVRPKVSVVAFPGKTGKGGEAPYSEQNPRIKTMVKELLEALVEEECKICLENHPTRANGYYTRDLLTLVGQVEVLKLPRIREGDFSPQKLLSEIGLAGAFQCLPFVLSA